LSKERGETKSKSSKKIKDGFRGELAKLLWLGCCRTSIKEKRGDAEYRKGLCLQNQGAECLNLV